MKNRQCQYIPHRDRASYEARGWTVEELPMPHAHYSLLAWRDEDDSEEESQIDRYLDKKRLQSRMPQRPPQLQRTHGQIYGNSVTFV